MWKIACKQQIVPSRKTLTQDREGSYPCAFFVVHIDSRSLVVNWFLRDGLSVHAGEWLAFALMILILFALCVALLRLAFGFFKRKGDPDVSERDYWRIHGG